MSPVFGVRARPIQNEALWISTGSNHVQPMCSLWSTQQIYQEVNQSNDPESYAGGTVVTGRVTHAGQVKG
jgi:hypothetical protein